MISGIVLLVLYGCRDETDSLYRGEDRKGTPVCFTAKWPQDSFGTTRAITDKKEFKNGDVMHVSAVFTLKSGTVAPGGEPVVKKYAALTLENGEWINKVDPDVNIDMNWPWNAESAVFTAYYLETWTAPITKTDTALEPVVLDRYVVNGDTINPDPLKAVTEKVEYGHAVHLEFEHLCARLTVTGVGEDSEYWFTFKTPASGEGKKLSNACTMTRLGGDKLNELEFSFTEKKEEVGDGKKEMVKIASQVDVDASGNRSVTFHLYPGDYRTFTLTRRNDYPYITISGVEELMVLEKGNSYTVSLEALTGNITQDDMDDSWWEEEEGEIYGKFETQEFMEAISGCKDYNITISNEDGTTKTVTLLKKNESRNEVMLMEDVDFGGALFNPVVLPNIVTFHGNGHTISGVDYPMFSNLSGSVKELNLKDVEMEHKGEGTPSSDPNHDTAWGVLAHICDGGRISNVSLRNASLDIMLHNKAPDGTGQDKVYNVGALVGWVKSGTLSDITLVDAVSVTVEAEETEAAYISCVGGVVGQCSGTMKNIINIGDGGDPLIRVTNNSKGYSAQYTGGVVGLLTNGSLEECGVRTEIHAENAAGTRNYTGGIAGTVRADEGIQTVVYKAVVAGSITGGSAIEYLDATPHSSTGGIVGHVKNASIMQSRTFSKVGMPELGGVSAKAQFTIGGVIGSIDSAREISDNEGLSEFDAAAFPAGFYAGRFVGGGAKEAELTAAGNSAGGEGPFVGYPYQ